MNSQAFKVGDYIYHHSKKLGTAHGKVVNIGAGGRNLKVEFDPSPSGTVWVKAEKCQLDAPGKFRP